MNGNTTINKNKSDNNKTLSDFKKLSKQERFNIIAIGIGTSVMGINIVRVIFEAEERLPSFLYFVFPFLLIAAIFYSFRYYLKINVILWISFIAAPLALYAYVVPWDENIRPVNYKEIYYNVPDVLKMASGSIVIFIFYYVHTQSVRARDMFVKILLIVSIASVIIRMMGLLGLVPGAYHMHRLGHRDFVYRINLYGDANIITMSLFPVIASLHIFMKKYNFNRAILIWVFLTGSAFMLTAAAASRGGTLALGAILVTTIFLSYIRYSSYRMRYLFLIIMGCGILLYSGDWVEENLATGLVKRTERFIEDEREDSGRVITLRWLMNELTSKPKLLGVGYEQYFNEVGKFIGRWGKYCPHNTFADFYIVGGLPFLLVWLTIWITAFRNTWRATSSTDPFIRQQSMFIFTWLIGTFVLSLSLSMAWNKNIWAVLGTGIGLGNVLKAEQKARQKAIEMKRLVPQTANYMQVYNNNPAMKMKG